MSLARTAVTTLGVAYVLLGVIGFLPDPLVQASGAPGASGALVGIFPINTALNVVHLAIGGSLLYASMATPSAIIAARIVGVVCAVLAVLGVASAGAFGPLPLGGAEIVLHLATAALLLAIGVTNSAE